MHGDKDIESTNGLNITKQEKDILESYDHLTELQLEIALLQTYSTLPQGEPVSVSELQLATAQKALLKAKAAFQIRCNVTESVITADPIVSAIHAGINATIHQQSLLPLLKKRDELSLSLIKISKKELETSEKLQKLETENIRRNRQNTELTKTMLDLVESTNAMLKSTESSGDTEKFLELKRDLRISQQRWRVMKETASACVVGSGIDWARDPKLLQIVIDEED